MRRIYPSLFAVSLIVSGAAPGQDRQVHYTLTPVMQDGQLKAVTVGMEFLADPSGRTELDLPDHWGGQKDLWRELNNFEVSGAHAKLDASNDPTKRIVLSDPDAQIRLRYNAAQDWQGVPQGSSGNPYRLVVQPSFFHLIGHALFVLPKGDTHRLATFAVRGLPPNWTLASTLTDGDSKLTLDDIDSSITVGGDFRVTIPKTSRGLVRIAIRGDWEFTDAEFAGDTARILQAERNYWHDQESPFLVTVLPLAGGQFLSSGGTGLNAGFGFFATPNVPMSSNTRTLAHENMHTWIPQLIGGLPDKDEAGGYWLSEGFTDFFSRRVLLRAGILSLADYVKVMNDTLYAYDTSSVRSVFNAQIIKDFWNDDYIQQLPYQRGFLLATMWNSQHRGVMDAVIHDMRERAKSTPAGTTALDLFPQTMKDHGLEVSADIARFIEHGEQVWLPADAFPACGRVAVENLPGFSYGFDPVATATAGRVITGIDPSGPAYAAGLRNGMKIVKHLSPPSKDPRDALAYEVSDNAGTLTIHYFPTSKTRFRVQQLQLERGLSGLAQKRCIAELAGGT